MINVSIEGALGFISNSDLSGFDTNKALNEMTALEESGWVGLPKAYDAIISERIKSVAAKITNQSDVLVVLGIGGSYLGARAAIEYVISPHYNILTKKTPRILFAGNNASGEYLQQIVEIIGDSNFSVNVISKSGSTIETSIALRFFKALLHERYGAAGLKERLIVTTDKTGSPLRDMASREGYECLYMPERVGGRYSVLTVVGLLPCAVAGINIDEMMAGALDEFDNGIKNACLYAAARQALYKKGKKIEMLACFEPAFRYTGEWWKQLFGESEGKENIGIFPAFAEYTADLHSLGQYIQEGERTLMETFVSFGKPRVNPVIPSGALHDDNISALSGMGMHEVNCSASEAVKKAHIDGGVPVIEIEVPELSAASFGALAYFFERACAVSALLSGVIPFGQPGVEAYKRNLYAILGLKK